MTYEELGLAWANSGERAMFSPSPLPLWLQEGVRVADFSFTFFHEELLILVHAESDGPRYPDEWLRWDLPPARKCQRLDGRLRANARGVVKVREEKEKKKYLDALRFSELR